MEKNCEVCKKNYKPTRGAKQRFCSRGCYFISDSFKNRLVNRRSYVGENNPFYGKKLTVEHIEAVRKAHLGKKLTDEHILKIKNGLSNEKCYAWKGGVSADWWMKRVLERDDYTCQICGLKDKDVVEADHIKSKAEYPELKNNLDNGQTLCANCHRRKTKFNQKILLKKLWKQGKMR